MHAPRSRRWARYLRRAYRFSHVSRLSGETNDLPPARLRAAAHARSNERETRIFGDCVGVAEYLGISVLNEHAAVTMALPFRDLLDVHAGVIKAFDAERAKIALGEMMKAEPRIRVRQGSARLVNSENALAVFRVAALFAKLLHERREPRINGDEKFFPGFLPNETQFLDAIVAPRKAPRFRLADSGEAEKFEKIARLFALVISPLHAHVGQNRFELVQRWNSSNRFAAPARFNELQFEWVRRFIENAIGDREVEHPAQKEPNRVEIAA